MGTGDRSESSSVLSRIGRVLVPLCGIIILHSQLASAQVITTGVPFLRISLSPLGNGIGEASGAYGSDDAWSQFMNPGHIGIGALDRYVSAGIYTSPTQWFPSFGINGLDIRGDAFSAGFRLNDVLDLPFTLGVGVGYARVLLNLGTFVRTLNSPDPIETFAASENASIYSLAVGLDVGVRIGLGLSRKKIESNLPPFGTAQEQISGKGEATAGDYGLTITLPLGELFSREKKFSPIVPIVDITISHAFANVGDDIVYGDLGTRDPLPRMSSMGLAVRLGAATERTGSRWELLTFTRVRQADEVLVRRTNADWSYKSWPGDMSYMTNVVVGKGTDRFDIHGGYEIQALEIFAIRRGSYDGPGFSPFTTEGYTIRSRGVTQVLNLLFGDSVGSGIASYLLAHLEIAYHTSSYKAGDSPLEGTSFEGISVSFR